MPPRIFGAILAVSSTITLLVGSFILGDFYHNAAINFYSGASIVSGLCIIAHHFVRKDFAGFTGPYMAGLAFFSTILPLWFSAMDPFNIVAHRFIPMVTGTIFVLKSAVDPLTLRAMGRGGKGVTPFFVTLLMTIAMLAILIGKPETSPGFNRAIVYIFAAYTFNASVFGHATETRATVFTIASASTDINYSLTLLASGLASKKSQDYMLFDRSYFPGMNHSAVLVSLGFGTLGTIVLLIHQARQMHCRKKSVQATSSMEAPLVPAPQGGLYNAPAGGATYPNQQQSMPMVAAIIGTAITMIAVVYMWISSTYYIKPDYNGGFSFVVTKVAGAISCLVYIVICAMSIVIAVLKRRQVRTELSVALTVMVMGMYLSNLNWAVPLAGFTGIGGVIRFAPALAFVGSTICLFSVLPFQQRSALTRGLSAQKGLSFLAIALGLLGVVCYYVNYRDADVPSSPTANTNQAVQTLASLVLLLSAVRSQETYMHTFVLYAAPVGVLTHGTAISVYAILPIAQLEFLGVASDVLQGCAFLIALVVSLIYMNGQDQVNDPNMTNMQAVAGYENQQYVTAPYQPYYPQGPPQPYGAAAQPPPQFRPQPSAPQGYYAETGTQQYEQPTLTASGGTHPTYA